jgi:ATP phosphoribosyltransferase
MAEAALTVALSKGRILTETLPLLAAVGIVPDEDPELSRRLILGTSNPAVRLLIVRPTDVPTYVLHGGADVGVTGKDVLAEQEQAVLYEPLDLGIGRCRLMLAGREGCDPPRAQPRVATKYVTSTRAFFAARGQQVDVIKLYGSMELAPLVGLADWIVDLVDTGNTLRANGLMPLETVMEVSARLVVNPASWKTKHAAVRALVADLAAVVERQGATA